MPAPLISVTDNENNNNNNKCFFSMFLNYILLNIYIYLLYCYFYLNLYQFYIVIFIFLIKYIFYHCMSFKFGYRDQIQSYLKISLQVSPISFFFLV